MEHTQIYHILKTQKIIAYFIYVDDILILYNNKNTNIDQTLNDFNNMQPTLKFTIEKEKHKNDTFSRPYNT
jgi:pyruvate/oxaloacetate carboxyltransferase